MKAGITVWGSAMALLGLAGCGTPPSDVKEVNANPDAFLAKNFTLQAIRPGFAESLKAVDAPGPTSFKEVTFKFEHRYRGIGAKEDSVTAPQTSFRPLGNGFFQEIRYLENNGFPVRRTFVLSFLGAMSLKREEASYQAKMTTFGSAIKDIKPFKFTPVKLTPGNKLTIDYAVGFPLQEFNFRWNKMACTSEKTGSAAELHPKIKGEAIWLACEGSNDTGAQSKNTSVYFTQYGMMLTMAYADPSFSSQDRITDFIEIAK